MNGPAENLPTSSPRVKLPNSASYSSLLTGEPNFSLFWILSISILAVFNLQATKLFIVTSVSKVFLVTTPLRFSVRFKILYRVIQPLIQHCLLHKICT